MSFDFSLWTKERQDKVAKNLKQALASRDAGSSNLQPAMAHLLVNGKFIRPLLCFASAEVSNLDYPGLINPACALELIHTYSLIHDDLPVMDDDELRRGLSSCHVEYGEALAILAGDALQTLAFELIADSRLTAEVKINLIKILAKASGAEGMVGGQALDLQYETRELSLAELNLMHAKKTGALIKAALMFGFVAGNKDDSKLERQLVTIGEGLGLLFQIQDDILDVSQDTGTLGKPAGSDAAKQKPTYVSILGLETARAKATALYAELAAKINQLPGNSEALAAICTFIYKRTF